MANVKRNQLTPLRIENLSEPGTYIDGGGLMLRVHPSGGKNWVLRLRIDGKRRNFGLGGYPTVTLATARSKAADARQRARDGFDPIPQDEPDAPGFEQAAEAVIELRAPTWTSERHATQWRESLRLHAMPLLGRKPVDKITTADVLRVLMPIWTAKAETAVRLRQRMATVFDFAIAAGWRTDNPCNGALKAALPRRPRQRRHHAAVPYPEVGDVIAAIRAAQGRDATKLGLEFVILVAARAGEVRAATWDEIDLEGAVWNVPPSHMKTRRPHRVPLSTGALAVLDQIETTSGLIFPSNRRQGLSNMAFTMLLRRAGYGDFTVHGFRASFRTWALEQTDAPWAVAEAALAHNLGGGEVVAYARSDLFERRRELMQQWGDYALPAGAVKVHGRAS